MKDEVSDQELKEVIADFLERGHADSVFEMFKREPMYYAWVGDILDDERFAVRLGLSVLFEELTQQCPDDVSLAVPSLCRVLDEAPAHVRGDAVNILGIIGGEAALNGVRKALNDSSLQVREVAQDVLEEAK